DLPGRQGGHRARRRRLGTRRRPVRGGPGGGLLVVGRGRARGAAPLRRLHRGAGPGRSQVVGVLLAAAGCGPHADRERGGGGARGRRGRGRPAARRGAARLTGSECGGWWCGAAEFSRRVGYSSRTIRATRTVPFLVACSSTRVNPIRVWNSIDRGFGGSGLTSQPSAAKPARAARAATASCSAAPAPRPRARGATTIRST